jgi:PRTRC genetic system protein B
MNEQTQRPLVRLDLYEQAIILTRFKEKGMASYPVSVHDLAAALADVPVSSGFLPANTLFWQRREGESQIGIYVPGRKWAVLIGERQLTIPMPPLIFTGRGNHYAVYAIKRRPRDAHCRLYHAPCPNVHLHGAICQGNAAFPICTPETIMPSLSLFLESSSFNGDLAQGKCQSHPDNVLTLWETLVRKKHFPKSEMVPTGKTLSSLL